MFKNFSVPSYYYFLYKYEAFTRTTLDILFRLIFSLTVSELASEVDLAWKTKETLPGKDLMLSETKGLKFWPLITFSPATRW